MKPDFHGWDLDAELVFDRFIGEGDELDVLQAALARMAPKWSTKLRLWRGPRDQRPIAIEQHGSVKSAVITAAGERGALYRELAERNPPAHERLVGSAELRGASAELIVIVTLDELAVGVPSSKPRLNNSIALQVRRRRVAGMPNDMWLSEVFESLCETLAPAWAAAYHPNQYWAKVMSDGPRIEAIGYDFGRYLPAVFWLNFFGRPYIDLVGREVWGSTPATLVRPVDGGVMIGLGSDPSEWDTPEHMIAEQRVRDHLGPELFFSKAQPNRATVAPDWNQ